MTKNKKDICENNYIVRWSLSLGLFIFGVLTLTILFIDYEVLRDPNVIHNDHLRIIGVVGAAFITLFCVHRFVTLLGRHLNKVYLSRFNEIKELGLYTESKPLYYNPNTKQSHGILLLHGFTASPQEFVGLEPHLQHEGLGYSSPHIAGFSINTAEMLHKTRYVDWFRSAVQAYDNLATYYEEISIVGHSLGAILALYVAQNRKVKNLILTSPGVFPTKQDIKHKRVFKFPLASFIYSCFLPYVPKPIRQGRDTTSDVMDDSVARNLFQYLAIPVNSIKQLFKAQDVVQQAIGKLKYKKLLIVSGKHDLTVNIHQFIHFMHKEGFVFNELELQNSAHSILEDSDKAECNFAISEFLKR